MNKQPDIFAEDDGSRDVIENNIQASVPFEYPDSEDAPPPPSSFRADLFRTLWRWLDEASIARGAIIANLPSDEREIYLLRRLHKKTFRDIAAILGRRDHKWALRRFNAAVSKVESAMPRPMGHQECPHFQQSLGNRGPNAPSTKRQVCSAINTRRRKYETANDSGELDLQTKELLGGRSGEVAQAADRRDR